MSWQNIRVPRRWKGWDWERSQTKLDEFTEEDKEENKKDGRRNQD